MAILNTLRTNKILKTLTFIIIGVGMYLFVDPQFDAFKTLSMVFSGEKNELSLNSYGASHGYQLYNSYERPSSRGGGVFISEPEEIAMQAHLSYLDFIQQSQNVTNTNKRNLNLIWDNFCQRSFIKKEMESLEFNYSTAEKIDLVKGTITGIDNAAPFFTSWWKALRTNDAGEVNPEIDGKVLEDSITIWTENSKENENQGNYLNYNFIFRPFHISNNEINRYNSLYNMGTFAPVSYLEKEYIDSKKTLNGKFIFIPFREVKDSEVEISEEEMLSYYKSNKENFLNNNPNRVIDYYIFNAQPTEKDIEFAKDQIVSRYLNNKNLESLRLDTTNQSRDLLNFVKKSSHNKEMVSFNNISISDLNTKYSITLNKKLDNYFGPIVENNIVKLGIIVSKDTDSLNVLFLNQDINPSPNTTNENFMRAKEFLYSSSDAKGYDLEAKKLENVIIKKDISISNLDENISGIESSSRQIVRWAFGIPDNINVPLSSIKIEERLGSARRFKTDIFNQVVVYLKEVNDQEFKNYESVKSQIKKTLLEKKKGELLVKKILDNWSENLNELSKSLNKKIESVSNFSYSAANFSVAGNDHGATGYFFSLDSNKISQPYIGERGVFVFENNGIKEYEANIENIISSRQSTLNKVNSEFNQNLLQQSKSGDIIDMRHMSF